MNERIIAHSPEILMTCLDQYYKKYCKWLQYAKHDYSLVISKQKRIVLSPVWVILNVLEPSQFSKSVISECLSN